MTVSDKQVFWIVLSSLFFLFLLVIGSNNSSVQNQSASDNPPASQQMREQFIAGLRAQTKGSDHMWTLEGTTAVLHTSRDPWLLGSQSRSVMCDMLYGELFKTDNFKEDNHRIFGFKQASIDYPGTPRINCPLE